MNELDVNEWYDVARVINPEMTRKEFQEDWNELQARKAEHLARKATQ